MTERPGPDEYAPYYDTYVSKVPDGEILHTLERQMVESQELLGRVTQDKAVTPYAPGKWNIREVVGHLADAERVFCHRALWFARGAPGPLPSFEQDDWVPTSGAADRTLSSLLTEWRVIRSGTVQLFAGLPEEALLRRGEASGASFTVRSFAWIIAGHEVHHHRLFKSAYGLA